ncbi:hypothetical protein M945_0044 [Clostridium saccharobutylicum DSM 13864]|nr:hypothetical protein M945_0044 [Clostridium saccharobutylicum DSM 13864]
MGRSLIKINLREKLGFLYNFNKKYINFRIIIAENAC